MNNNQPKETAKIQGKYGIYVAIISGAFALLVTLINLWFDGPPNKEMQSNSKIEDITSLTKNELSADSQSSRANANPINNLHDKDDKPTVVNYGNRKPSNSFLKVFQGYIKDTLDHPIDSAEISIMIPGGRAFSGFSNDNGLYEIEITKFPKRISQVEIHCRKEGFKPQQEWTDVMNAKKNFELKTKK